MGIKLTEVGGVWREFPEPGDRYKYFMGNTIVEVIGVGMNTEFGDDEVIFRLKSDSIKRYMVEEISFQKRNGTERLQISLTWQKLSREQLISLSIIWKKPKRIEFISCHDGREIISEYCEVDFKGQKLRFVLTQKDIREGKKKEVTKRILKMLEEE